MLNERNTLLEDDGIEEEILVEEECSVAQAVWGDIQGNIENQTDLQNALDAKQDSLTEAQLNAVNSGITAEKVTTYDGYADQIASKADQSALNTEATTREQADTALGRRIDDEATARQNADNGLQTQIDAITSQSDVVDVVANYAALQAYDTSSLSDNDVIKVLDDETHEDALTYYRWSTATQTWSYIGQEAPYYSKGQMDVKLAEKQDKLTAGANIQIQNGTISATDTKYTAGNGLNLEGTEFSADIDVLATKEDLEDYYNKTESDNLLAPKLEAEVVAELPTAGEEGKLYLTPKAHTTQTATGNPVTATVSDDAGALESFQLDGDTFQQTYEGKNLFNKNNPNMFVGYVGWNGAINSTSADRMIYIPCEPNTTYSIQKPVPTTNPKFRVAVSTDVPTNGGTATVLTNDSYMSLGEATVTTREDSAYLMVYIWVNSSDMTLDEVLSGIQIEVGSSVGSFEPYVGGIPSPNPEYPQPIQTVTGVQTIRICGLNIYDKSKDLVGYALTGNGVEIALPAWHISDYIPVVGGETYIVTGMTTPGGTARTCYYDSAKNLIEAVPQQTSPYTITPPSGSAYVRLSIFNLGGQLDSNTLQIELGSTAHNYEAYSGADYPLDLSDIELCGLGDDGAGGFLYKDRIFKDGEDWKVHKETGSITLNGSESDWRTIQMVNNYRYYLNISNIVSPQSSAGETIGLCSHFSRTTPGGQWGSPAGSQSFIINNSANPNSSIGFTVGDSTDKSTEFKAWLAENTPTVLYALYTSTDTVITDTTLIAQLEAIRTALLQNGANTITNTATGSNLAGDMEIGYYGFAPRNRYDKWLWLDINNEYEQIGS